MIIFAKDLTGNNKNIRSVVAALGITALGSSLSSIAFQFTDDGAGLENILTPEKEKVGLAGAISLRETGLDALFNMSSVKKLTAEDFKDACMNLTSGKPFDVAEITKNEEFKDIAEDRLEDIKAMLLGADEIYDFVFVIYDGAYAELMERLKGSEGAGLFTVDHYADVNITKTDKDTLILTDFKISSSFTAKSIAKANGIKDTLYTLPYPVAFMDAVKGKNLYRYLKEVRNADKDITDPAAEFVTDLKEIVDGLAGNKKKIPQEDLWDSFAEPIAEQRIEELTDGELKKALANEVSKVTEESENEAEPQNVDTKPKKKGLFGKK